MKIPIIVNLKHKHYDLYIGRPSIWGNPYVIGKHGNRAEVLEKYREYAKNNKLLWKRLYTLDGMILGCYCKPFACHGDILIEMFIEHFKDEI